LRDEPGDFGYLGGEGSFWASDESNDLQECLYVIIILLVTLSVFDTPD
jgi:hypothetical protein